MMTPTVWNLRTGLKAAAPSAARRAGMIAVLALASLATGCSSLPSLSSLNPFSTKAVNKNPPSALVALTPSLVVRTVWTGNIGAAGAYRFAPAPAGDSIYVAAHDGAIARLDAASGKTTWRINAGERLTAGVGSDGTTVAVAAEKGRILAFDASGALRWSAQASSEVLSAPAVGEGLVIVRSEDNRIVGLDAATGARKWVVQRSAPGLILRAAPGILIAAPNAYVSLPGGKLVAIALATGAPRWEAAVGEARGSTELERIVDTVGKPVLVGREVCAVSFQGRAICFDSSSGTVVWSKELSAEVGLGADERFITAVDTTGAVSAFTIETGASVWKNKQLAYRRLSAPVSIGRAVAVGDFEGQVHFLNREDGALMARIGTDGSAIHAAPVLAGANLIVQTSAGAVLAVTIQ